MAFIIKPLLKKPRQELETELFQAIADGGFEHVQDCVKEFEKKFNKASFEQGDGEPLDIPCFSCVNERGNGFLHKAIFEGRKDITFFLIDYFQNKIQDASWYQYHHDPMWIVNKKNQTPLWAAAMMGYADVVQTLLDARSANELYFTGDLPEEKEIWPLQLCDSNGLNPVAAAEKFNHAEVIALLNRREGKPYVITRIESKEEEVTVTEPEEEIVPLLQEEKKEEKQEKQKMERKEKGKQPIRPSPEDIEAATVQLPGATVLSKRSGYVAKDFKALTHALPRTDLAQLHKVIKKAKSGLASFLRLEFWFDMGIYLAFCLSLAAAVYSAFNLFNPDNWNIKTGEMNTTAKISAQIFASTFSVVVLLPCISYYFHERYFSRRRRSTVGQLSSSMQEKYQSLLAGLSSLQTSLETKGLQAESRLVQHYHSLLSTSNLVIESVYYNVSVLEQDIHLALTPAKPKTPWSSLFSGKSKEDVPVTPRKLEEGPKITFVS